MFRCLLFILCLGLAACAHDHNDHEQIQAANNEKAQMDAIERALVAKGVYVGSASQSEAGLLRMDRAELGRTREQVQRFITLGRDVLRVANQKGVVYGDAEKVKMFLVTSEALLARIDKLAAPVAPAVAENPSLRDAEEFLDANFSFAGVDMTAFDKRRDLPKVMKLSPARRARMRGLAQDCLETLNVLIPAKRAGSEEVAALELEAQRSRLQSLLQSLDSLSSRPARSSRG
jgi:hypothetical protein